MKLNIYLIALLLTGALFASCKKSDIKYESNYEASYRSWTDFKQSSQNSYRYMVSFGSWTGAGSETTITVTNGKITGRSFVAKTYEDPQSNVITIVKEWTEDESSINTHGEGYPAMTLDEVYQKAKTDWLLKRKDVTTYFETNNGGMISSCGYTPKNCIDDCFTGIKIQYIEKL